jgi:SAM-dependent methyltransferase
LHASQYEHMKRALELHLPEGQHLEVLELGSATSPGQRQTHRSLFDKIDHSYVGVDVREGETVDIVMEEPYTIPAASNSKDVIICGSVLEHVPFFWASMLEMARVLRPEGLLFVTVPSRGHKHSAIDCWRVYPDGLRAMALWARLAVVESHVHYPPQTPEHRHDYARIDAKHHYWGDAVGVFRKPTDYPREMHLVQRAIRRWANQASEDGPLGTSPRPRSDCSVLARRGALSTGGPAVLDGDSGTTGTSIEDRVLKAASDEFLSHGIGGARYDRIAFAAGLVDKAELFDLFGDKDQLFDAAVAKGLISKEDGSALHR